MTDKAKTALDMTKDQYTDHVIALLRWFKDENIACRTAVVMMLDAAEQVLYQEHKRDPEETAWIIPILLKAFNAKVNKIIETKDDNQISA